MAKRGKRGSGLPRNIDYRPASAFDVRTGTGRARLWQQRFTRAREMLKINDRSLQRGELLHYIDGSQIISDARQLYFNEAKPAIDDAIYGMLPTIPSFDVEARRQEDEPLAGKARALLDQVFSTGLVRAYEAITDAEWDEKCWGIGFVKLGWRRDRYIVIPQEPRQDEGLVGHAIEAEIENADFTKAMVVEDDDDLQHIAVHLTRLRGLSPDHEQYVAGQRHLRAHYARLGEQAWEYPVMQRVNPLRFLYDPDCEVWEDRRWEAELCSELVADLQDVPGIRNLNPENCPTIDEFEQFDEKRPLADFDFEATRVQVWKTHDIAEGSYSIIPAHISESVKPLLETDWPYGSLDVYRPIVHNKITGQIHGTAQLRLLKPVLDELKRVNAIIGTLNRKAGAAKKIAAKGALTAEDIAKIEAEALIVAEVSPQALANMQEFAPDAAPPQLIEYREKLLSEIRRQLGSDLLHQGGDYESPITASEVQARVGYQEDRLDRRRRRANEILEWAGYNVLMLYQKFAAEALNVRVLGGTGAEMVSLDPAALPEDLRVKIDVEATSPTRTAQDVNAMLQYATLLAKSAPGLYDPTKVLIDIGYKLRIRNPEKYFVQIGAATMPAPGGVPPTAPQGPLARTPNIPNLQG